MTKRQRGQWGFARIEYLACLPEIQSQLAAGYPVRSVYNKMFESGKITMCYPHFCKYVTGNVSAQIPAARASRKPRKANLAKSHDESEALSESSLLPAVLIADSVSTVTTPTDETKPKSLPVIPFNPLGFNYISLTDGEV